MAQRPMVGVGVIVTRDDYVLLMKRHGSHGSGTWSMPGGHLEFGESPQECAIRETFEETGITIDNVVFRSITNDVFEKEEKHYITIWVEGAYVSGEAIINSAYEMTEVGWFSWGSLPVPLFLPFRNLLEGAGMPPFERKSLLTSE
ncbi:NUDIX domain-containing protein [Reticulibacter mediterranei]|uniref:NUDIX domain-containing protein n=1 Tax=Reticulibacter mediterranei TaxID=2778369 RepID=A0A8J3ILU4_9CHLR|nr:NUDIX domain-containing protein [Reticulibacter mediterranei]GHO93030.1 NUDIX domain-containing protein [Reticulibacter mediterranei]